MRRALGPLAQCVNVTITVSCQHVSSFSLALVVRNKSWYREVLFLGQGHEASCPVVAWFAEEDAAVFSVHVLYNDCQTCDVVVLNMSLQW